MTTKNKIKNIRNSGSFTDTFGLLVRSAQRCLLNEKKKLKNLKFGFVVLN